MANELELRIEQKVGILNWNFEELTKAVDAQLEKYRDLVITEDQIKDAKDMRAKLNNLSKAIEDRRKDAKKEFCKPYDDFAEQVKEITSKIKTASDGIDRQIKNFEELEKDEKKQRIEIWWYGNCYTEPQISFDKVFDKKFLNKTCKDADWQKDLEGKFNQIQKDLQAIQAIEDRQKRDYVISEYQQSVSLGDALGKWELYAERLRQAEEFNKRAEAEAQRAINHAETLKNLANSGSKQETLTNIQSTANTPKNGQKTGNFGEQEIYKRVLYVEATKEQLWMLADFMNKNGIKFKKAEG